MKHSLLILAAAAALLAGCKTNEANYRAAYETAVNQREARESDGSVASAQLQKYNAPRPQVTPEGDTILVRIERVRPTKIDAVATSGQLQQYNIVVGQFRQLFNARAMLERLVAGGYPGAFVVQTGEPVYYVVAMSLDNSAATTAALRKVQADESMKLREPLPFILSPL